MRPETRDRLVLPILLPVGIVVLMAAVLFGFSRVLLNVEGHAATVTALVVAAGIVVAAAVAATRPQVRGSTVVAMAGAVAGVAMLSGGIALAVIAGGGGEAEGGGGGGPTAVVALEAKNISFVQSTLDVPAAKAFTLKFTNSDAGTQHNVQIFDNANFSGNPVFSGDLVTGVATANYAVPALPAGTYSFRCEVHPQMVGKITASAGGGGGAGGGAITVTAQNISFDTNEIDLTPGAPSTITFDNKDTGVQHNIAIYTDDSLSKVLFKGDLVTGPGTATYQVPALDAGTYYFHCDVHPTMNGSVVVGGNGGGGGASGASGSSGGGASGSSGSGGATTGSTGSGGGGTTAQPATVTAQNLSFDTNTITLPAGSAATLTFDNKDTGVQHNIAIYTDDSLSKNLFRGDLVTGPNTATYQIPALDAGTYYFHCDVHPTMSGTVTVS